MSEIQLLAAILNNSQNLLLEIAFMHVFMKDARILIVNRTFALRGHSCWNSMTQVYCLSV